MPRRKRHQEWKRRYRKAVAEVEAQEINDLRLALAETSGPLDDFWWLEHERGEPYCCDLCCPNDPDMLLADARREIATYKRRASP